MRRSRSWRRATTRSSPSVIVFADEHLAAPEKEKVRERLSTWLAEIIGERLKPLVEIDAAQDIAGLARGIAFRLKENFGVLRREAVAEEIRSLDQPARAQLRKYGVRFGAFNIFFPTMLKPASSELAAVLWVAQARRGAWARHRRHARAAAAGLTSVATNAATPESSTAWPAFTSADRARSASTCWSGWRT